MATAVGWRDADDGPQTIALYAFGSDEEAREATSPIESLWRHGWTASGVFLGEMVQVVDVRTAGPVVSVYLRGLGDDEELRLRRGAMFAHDAASQGETSMACYPRG